MTQQTIGNTVYTVGQIVSFDELIKLPVNTKVDGFGNPKDVQLKELAFQITALPNPDPVVDEWREVKLQFHKFDPDEAMGFYPFHTLQLAMQKAMQADTVRLEWPVFIHKAPEVWFVWADGVIHEDCISETITCFLLGGVVKVKGGM